jgi:DNA-binding GntR family transcriptional regulator
MMDIPDKKKKSTHLSLRQMAYEQIKHDIITCQLSPGEPLSEGRFADRFQISKTPVREALTSLQKDRLVEYTPNRGFVVAPVSYKDVQEIFEARQFYETALFKLALKYISDEDIELLQGYSKLEHNPEDPDAIELYQQANYDFHMGIARIARNSRLYWHYNNILNEAQRLIYLDFKNTNIVTEWHHSHHDIIRALRDRDMDAGLQAIEETLEKARKRILET